MPVLYYYIICYIIIFPYKIITYPYKVWQVNKIIFMLTTSSIQSRYTDDRNEMIRVVGGMVGRHNINTDNHLIQMKNILLEGYNQMTQSENTAILNAVQLFIENTNRFQSSEDKLNIITVTFIITGIYTMYLSTVNNMYQNVIE